MKRKYLSSLLLTGAAAFTACKEQPSNPASTESNAPLTEIAMNEPTTVKASASVEDRAAKLGFAKYISKDLLTYEAIYNAGDAFEELMQTPMGALILKRMEAEGLNIESIIENSEIQSSLAMYSEEYFTAYGKGAPEAVGLLFDYIQRAVFYAARTGVFVADAQVKDGRFKPESPQVLLDGPLKGGIKEFVGMFEQAEIPSFYQGIKVSDEDARGEVANQMQVAIGMMAFAQDAAEEVTTKRGDHEFSGFKISGEKLVEMLNKADTEDIEEFVDATDMVSFKESLAKKNLVALTGVVGDYVLLFVGRSEDEFVLVNNAKDSVCANEKMAFIDRYLDKKILMAGYRDDEILNSFNGLSGIGYGIIGAAVNGAVKGLDEASSFGDTSDIEALLESLSNQGDSMTSLFKAQDSGYVMYLEDGIKAETYGGSNMPHLNLEKSHTFSPMEASEGTLLFANWTTNEEYNEKVMEYIDTLGEAAYLVTKRIASLDINEPGFSGVKQGFGLFDQKVRKDVLGLWSALRVDLTGGLGSESAVVVDLNGSFPRLPNIPESVIGKGKIPRIAYVSDVKDREKLQASWNRINKSAENILKTIGEVKGAEIPMQIPMSSEKNELKTWFVPIPFQNDDFVPSVSVSDRLFFASSSKTFSEGLAESIKKGEGTNRKGVWVNVDFLVLNQYAQDWLKLIEDNLDDAMTSESIREDFKSNRNDIRSALKALESLEALTVHTRNENGGMRISLHLKVK